jgi:TP901 family phage tail tape measure protein
MIKGMGIAYGLSSLFSGVSNVFKSATAYDNITQTTRNILSTHDKRSDFEDRFAETNRLMRQVGVETKFTAPEVAEAGKFLAMAGFNVDQIKSSIRPIADIALIGDNDLGETADVVTNIMTAYEIPAQKMRTVADMLAMTSTKTNSTLRTLAESFVYAGTVAKQTGTSFETAASALGILGDAGIKGSHAGTTLRMILSNIIKPTTAAQKAWAKMGVSTRDENGNLRDITDIFTDLNAKKQTMNAADYSNLMFNMFRITAVPGALAMVSNVDKLRDVVGLNRESDGLSEKLADAKKNTVQGLWYQMTSAFTETGMQGFESMQGTIRDFLQRMIALMKSPDFAEALRSAMDTFLKIFNAIVEVFQSITKIWNFIPNWFKDFLVWGIKWQMQLGMIAGIAKSIMSTFLMIRGILMGSWLSSLWGVVVKIGLAAKNLYQTIAFGRAMQLGWGGIMSLLGSGGVAALRAGGTAAVSGGASAVAGAGGAMAGKSFVSVLGSIASFFLTNPIGWGIAAAAAVGGVAYAVYKSNRELEESCNLTHQWSLSMQNMGLEGLNMADQNDYLIAKFRIMSNTLLSEQERVEKLTKVWNEYWNAKNNKEPEVDNSQPYKDTDAGKADTNFADKINWLNKVITWGNRKDVTSNLFYQLGGSLETVANMNAPNTYRGYLPGLSFSLGYDKDGKPNWDNKSVLAGLALYQMGADKNNSIVKAMELDAMQRIWSVQNASDAQNMLSGLISTYTPQQNPAYDNVTAEMVNSMTYDEIKSSLWFIAALAPQLQGVADAYAPLITSMQDWDAGKSVDIAGLQDVLYKWGNLTYAHIINPANGAFGSAEWTQYWQNVLADPTKYNFKDAQDVANQVMAGWDEFLNLYNQMKGYKNLFVPFLNSDIWNQMLPSGYSLTPGGYTTGKPGETRVVNGVVYHWQSNLVSLAGGQWVDSNNKPYVPKTSKDTMQPTNTWTPSKNTPTGGAHNGADQSQYKSHYNNTSAAPKQVIVRIENLMRVDKQTIDMNDGRQVAAINSIKQELATALLDVVQDFNANIVS